MLLCTIFQYHVGVPLFNIMLKYHFSISCWSTTFNIMLEYHFQYHVEVPLFNIMLEYHFSISCWSTTFQYHVEVPLFNIMLEYHFSISCWSTTFNIMLKYHFSISCWSTISELLKDTWKHYWLWRYARLFMKLSFFSMVAERINEVLHDVCMLVSVANPLEHPTYP